jgi:hypothetical protein
VAFKIVAFGFAAHDLTMVRRGALGLFVYKFVRCEFAAFGLAMFRRVAFAFFAFGIVAFEFAASALGDVNDRVAGRTLAWAAFATGATFATEAALVVAAAVSRIGSVRTATLYHPSFLPDAIATVI